MGPGWGGERSDTGLGGSRRRWSFPGRVAKKGFVSLSRSSVMGSAASFAYVSCLSAEEVCTACGLSEEQA